MQRGIDPTNKQVPIKVVDLEARRLSMPLHGFWSAQPGICPAKCDAEVALLAQICIILADETIAGCARRVQFSIATRHPESSVTLAS